MLLTQANSRPHTMGFGHGAETIVLWGKSDLWQRAHFLMPSFAAQTFKWCYSSLVLHKVSQKTATAARQDGNNKGYQIHPKASGADHQMEVGGNLSSATVLLQKGVD